MIRLVAAFGFAAALSACGAEGDPITPTANASVGVSTSGVYGKTNVGVSKGPWNFSLGRLF